MDRQIIYAGAVPLDTDQLLQSRNTMVAIGYLAKMILGDNRSFADGLTCVPGDGLSIVVEPGSLTFPTVVDSLFVGSLPPNSSSCIKIGINTEPVTLTVSGPGHFLISASVAEEPAGNNVLPYYNAANPQQTLFGPSNSGAAQPSILQQQVKITMTSIDNMPAENTPLWLVIVPDNALAITMEMISIAPGAPFVAVKLPYAAPLASPAFIGSPNAPIPEAGDVSSLLATTEFVSKGTARSRAVWTAPGTYSWTCPIGISQVLFRGWGPGGAGGIGSAGYAGGGGGGGGYLEVLLSVTGGQAYEVIVGTGGTNSTAVKATSFGGVLSVFGGGNGGNGGGSQSGAGGTAGTDAVLQLEALSNPGTSVGQAGYLIGNTSIGGAGGGSFGTPQGYPNTGSGAGAAGFWPGGGGAGGAVGAGGNGAAGLVILEWCGGTSK